MVDFAKLSKSLKQTVLDNSPAILTAVAVTGTVTTAVLTGRAAYHAREVIEYEQINSGPLETSEKFKAVWTLYIPPAVVGAATISCIIGANTISSRRNAALISLYSLSEKAFSEYKDKVIEQVGANQEQKIRDSIAQDQVNRDPVSSKEIIITGSGDVMCYESLSGRYFKSNVETIRKAMNDINYEINSAMYASLNDFYNLIGLPTTGYGEEVGWNFDNPLDVQFSTVLSEDGQPCISIGYSVYPVRDYHKIR